MLSKIYFKRLLFYWVTSFTIATLSFYLLWNIMPENYVFGAWIRMYLYHWEHPLQFILIPCFFYGIIASTISEKFAKIKLPGQIFLTLAIILLTILISSPFGGMLWHYYYMKSGYFPLNWLSKMIVNGFSDGISIGWFIILLSIPYNILGCICCFFITRTGSKLFRN